MEASDNMIVDNVVQELEQDVFGEEMLTQKDYNLGCFSLSKVHLSRTLAYSIFNCVNHSSPISERGFSTAQLFALTLKSAVIGQNQTSSYSLSQVYKI